MATNIITTQDVDSNDFGCRAGQLGINWANIPCSVVTACSDASDEGSLSYDSNTGILTHTNSNGDTQSVNLPLESFLQSVTEDNVAKTLTFTWNTDSGIAETTIDLSDLVDVYALEVTDTDCIDLTLTGDGSQTTPWNISAAPRLDPSGDNALSCTAAGLFGAATVVEVSDTSCVDMTISGAGTVSSPYVISADPIVDPVDNALSCTAAGLYVAPTELSVLDTSCVDMTLTGTGTVADPYVVSADPIIDATVVQNALECNAGGLSVDIEAWVAAEPFDCSSLPAL